MSQFVCEMEKELEFFRCKFYFFVLGLFFICTFFSANCCESENLHTFMISGDEGVTESNFDSLEALQYHLKRQSSTELGQNGSIAIIITTPELKLTQKLTFSHYSCLVISANISDNSIVTCNESNAGIMFYNIKSLKLTRLTFVSCGAYANLSTTKQKNYYSAIFLYNIRNVEIMNVTVYKSHGVGLIIYCHQGGNIIVTESTFEQNVIRDHEYSNSYKELGGGGVFIKEFDIEEGHHAAIEFHACTFKQNSAHTRYYRDIFTNHAGEEVDGHGRGGGLFLEFVQNNGESDIIVTISNCSFLENKAFIGSGLSINIGEVGKQKIELYVTDTLFERNGCKEKRNEGIGFGGGAHFSFSSYGSSVVYPEVTLKNVKFNRNCALHGGGVFIYSHKLDSNNFSNVLLFDECHFHNNHAITGSAVDTSPHIFKRLSTGYTIIPIFRNCNFRSNRVRVGTETYTEARQRNSGLGTVYASLCDVIFEGFTLFKDNLGTAVYVVNSKVDCHNSNVRFVNNSGVDGGALALLGESSMVVGANSTYEFINNSAIYRGGAVFVLLIDNHDFLLSGSCFFQYKDESEACTPLVASKWTSTVTFSGNCAGLAGHSIFATSVLPCEVINNGSDASPHYVRVHVYVAFESWGISFDDRFNMTKQITTSGGQLTTGSSKLKLIPGHYGNHQVKVLDDLKTEVNEPLRTMVREVAENGSVELDTISSSFVRDKVLLMGESGSTARLSFQVESPRQTYITLCVELQECPPGFRLQNKLCECDAANYTGIINCNNTHSYLLTGYWAGVVVEDEASNRQFATSTCPLGYCFAPNDSTTTELPESLNDLEDKNIICGPNNRKGVLCGKCLENFTVYFHSVDFLCRKEDGCHYGWLLYIALELVPVTLLFVTVLILNISFTAGTVNGFILFSQLLISMNIDASGIIQLPEKIKPVITTYRFIYGFFNLEFFNSNGTSFCLLKGASALEIIAFKYVTIAYALLLVLFVIWLMNSCAGRCLGKWCRITTIKSSVIHGISAFLIVCYSQSLKTSLYLVNGHEVVVHESRNFTSTKRVWFNGELKQFEPRHLPYAILALLSLIILGILPPFLLLAGPFLNKVLDVLKIEDSKVVSFILRWIIPVNSLKPFLDSFQGCFKDDMRFFAGLYFLYRWSALVSYTVTSRYVVAYAVSQVLFTVFLTLHSLCQPYTKRAHNVIDTLLFADISTINFITLLHSAIFSSERARAAFKNTVFTTASIQMILIFIPLVIFVVYVFVLVYNQLLSCYHSKKPRKRTGKYDVSFNAFASLLKNVSSHSQQIDQPLDDLPHRLVADDCDQDGFEDSVYTESKAYREADNATAYNF